MNIEEYAELDATGVAELIRSGAVPADEVHQVAVEAIGTVQPEINACVAEPWSSPLDYDRTGPFAGVPFGLKDLVCHAAGVPSRWGSRLTGERGVVFDHDSELMARFRKAGLATTALTATPEMGYGGNTEPLVNGSTRNPWDLSRSVGGSSGGSAALVASGAVPVAHANDAGGSIRIPSSFNGTVGLKPSRGVVSLGPHFAEGATGLASEFVITRSVRDVAGILDQVAGWVPGERYRVQAPSRPYVDELSAEHSGLRIAVHTDSWAGTAVDRDVVAAVESVASALRDLGHHVEAATPTFDYDEFMVAECRFWATFAKDCVVAASALSGLAPGPETLEASTLAGYEAGLRMTAPQLSEALDIQNRTSRALGEFFTRYDLIITPTTNSPALPLGFLDHDDDTISAEEWTHEFHDHLSFTPLFNQTGTPAISLPLGQSSTGLPIGVQLAADMCQEPLLIAVSAQLERAMPWKGRRPAVHVSR
ncbi:amidase [Pseudonocardia broussonetiae]|uniref:Amidase n=1 Tax=Pseudonocardia broussonetiae TaxID=2736640 RepID=A0A6M6JMV2_9PSEU|nr:amidase family protein [Pseudonocardia broussonetiae]QJY47759.1 amidase [Pseudonocardia broussonetiae]